MVVNQDLRVQIEKFESLDPLFNVDSYTPGKTKLYCAMHEQESGGQKKLSDRLPAYSFLEWINGFLCAYEFGVEELIYGEDNERAS